MKYSDLRLIEKKLQEKKDDFVVIVVYVGGERYQITDISKKHMDAPTFADAIKKMAERKFPNLKFKTFFVVGDDGKKVDGYDFEVLKQKELDKDGVPDKKTDDTTDDQGEIEPVDRKETEVEAEDVKKNIEDAAEESDEVDETEIEVTVDNEEPAELTVNGVQVVNADDLDKMMDEYADKVDKDGDGLNDETGEPVLRSDQLPKINLPSPGGDEGESGEGEEGEEGEAGATEGQKAIVPEIIDEVKAGLKGIGTQEGRIIRALKRIETPGHFKEVVIAYKEKYGVPIGNDILNDIRYDPNFNKIFAKELSRIFSMIGYKLYRHKNGFRTIQFAKSKPSIMHREVTFGDE
jgi:hypothetical protein